jgi:hypothetical protein
MKWDFRRLPPIHTENTDWHRYFGDKAYYANDSAGGVR